MVGKITKDNWLGFALTLWVCLLCIGTAYRHMSIAIEILVLLSLGIAYFINLRTSKPLEKNEKLFIVALVFFFVSALFSYMIGNGWELKSVRNSSMPSLIDLDLPSKYLLGALTFYLFAKLDFKICKQAVFGAIAMGGIINGCIAIYQRYVLGLGRIDGWSGIAEMADASAVLGIFSLIFFIFARSNKERVFYALAIFMACFASILTGTRGAMLGIILTFILIGVVILIKKRQLWKVFLLGVFCGSLGFGISLVEQHDTLRFKSAQNDIEKYVDGDLHDNSLGARFEMWKEAVAMFQMAPVFGLSTYEISKNLKEIREKSKSRIFRDSKDKNPRDQAVGNKHNQILNQAAKRGIVGVFAILFVWFSSFKMFASSFKKNNFTFVLALCMMSMFFYFIFPNSFTGEPWESNVSFPLMTLLICVFWKLIYIENKNAN